MSKGIGVCVTGSPNATTCFARRIAPRSSAKLSAPASTMKHRVELHPVAELVHLVGRREPDRREQLQQVRGLAVQDHRVVALGLQQLLQRVRLAGQSTTPILQVSASCQASRFAFACCVRLVDQPEVRLEPVEHGGVRAEQRAVLGEQRLEHGLPPGQLELGAHVLGRDVAAGEVREQRVELQVAQPGHDRGALLQVVQHLGVGGERLQAIGQQLDLLLQQAVGRVPEPERLVERA